MLVTPFVVGDLTREQFGFSRSSAMSSKGSRRNSKTKSLGSGQSDMPMSVERARKLRISLYVAVAVGAVGMLALLLWTV
jgi:hypothetical protein